ncbi:MAG: hypothetical protein HUU15_07605 [Candidatus Brocadiae bacterium]|nr:hypothetical protein [Candidatus Brocadiia bacterium]
MKCFRMLTALMAAIRDVSLLRFEFVLAENKIPRGQNSGLVKLTDGDRRHPRQLRAGG